MNLFLRVLPVLLLILASPGCGSGARIVSVSGKVLIDGKPTANVHVEFLPIGGPNNPNPGPASIGVTDENGVFKLKCVQTSDTGAVVGKHRVKINIQNASDEDFVELPNGKVRKNTTKTKQLPARYNSETTLEFEVPPGGTDKADFDLKRD